MFRYLVPRRLPSTGTTSANRATAAQRSMAHPVAQVQHPVALDDHVGILEQVLGRRRARSSACPSRTPPARRPSPPRPPVRARGSGRRRRRRPPRPCGPRPGPWPWRSPRSRRRRSGTTPRGASPSGLGRWDTTTTWSPAGGRPSQPFVRSNRWRPITIAPIAVPHRPDVLVDARDLETPPAPERSYSWSPSSAIGVSPLKYQSNSGPTSSFSSAMKPSTDTTLCMTTLPITSPGPRTLIAKA